MVKKKRTGRAKHSSLDDALFSSSADGKTIPKNPVEEEQNFTHPGGSLGDGSNTERW